MPRSSTRPTRDASRSVGAGDFESPIVAISSATDASIFATMALKNLGVSQVIAKAASKLHGAILERIGADRVIYAETEMGQRVAHSLSIVGVLDYLDVAPRFGIVKIASAGQPWVGQSLKDLDLGAAQISPVALRRGKDVTVNPSRDVVLEREDERILLGRDEQLAADRPLRRLRARGEQVDARCHDARDDHDDVARQEQQPRHQV